MKLALRFSKGQLATFERGVWSCADLTLLACCKAATRGRSAEESPSIYLRTVKRFAERMSAELKTEGVPSLADEKKARRERLANRP